MPLANPLITAGELRGRKPPKYRNQRTVVDGLAFDSKREAVVYVNIKLMKAAGDVLWFLRQVPFRLAGGVKYVADFLLVMKSGGVRVIDAKGMQTPTFKLKMKLMREAFPEVDVELW